MVSQDSLLVTLVKIVDCLPMPRWQQNAGVGIRKCPRNQALTFSTFHVILLVLGNPIRNTQT